MKIYALLFLALPLAISATNATLSCLNNNGGSVPWFLTYKYPANVSADTPQYAYLDSTTSSGFTFPSSAVDSDGQALAATIAAINAIPTAYFSLLVWNDQNPDGTVTYTGGHSKGILAYNNNTNQGVYIMHSVPGYPTVSDYGEIDATIPESGLEYAQTFYCITFGESQLGTIIQNLEVIYPVIYYIKGEFRSDNFKDSTLMKKVSPLSLVNGQSLEFISKSPNYTTGYLYENIVEPTLQINLRVQSWGRPYMPSVCPGQATYYTLNIDYFEFSNKIAWNHYSDHSKWAISNGTTPGYACICDMNRMTAQETRGGSCLCSTNSILYNALNSIAIYCDPCSKGFLSLEY